MEWLLTPLSGSADHHVASWTYWHARWMVLGWGILLPTGALVARFFKVTPRQDWPRQLDNKTWWHAHRALQYGGVAAMSVGVLLAWGMGGRGSLAAQVHAWLGWGLCAAGWLQLASGLARGSKGGPTDQRLRGDHYDMTPWRIGFEHMHKLLGWAAMAVAVVVIVLGLLVADAPRWMLLVLGLWWLGFATLFALWQRQGRCMDTYQAIWGPDESHPGNRRASTVGGSRRYTAQEWARRFGPW
jgi:hypothetical protein